MLAFFKSSRATNRSLEDASGSERMEESWERCAGRRRCATSPKAVAERVRRAEPGTVR